MSDGGDHGKTPAQADSDLESVYQRVRRVALRLLGGRDGVEDVTQASMEAFLKARHSYRGEGSVEAFAEGIAANMARTWMRRQRRTSLILELVAEREPWSSLAREPSVEAETRDRLRRLLEILRRLKPKYRMAYMLYHVEGKTVREIASIEATSESAVRTRILRARRHIRALARRDPVLSEWLEGMGGGE